MLLSKSSHYFGDIAIYFLHVNHSDKMVLIISKLFSLLLSAVPHLNHAVVPPGVYDRRPPVGRRDAGTETSEEESKLRQVRACSKGPVK